MLVHKVGGQPAWRVGRRDHRRFWLGLGIGAVSGELCVRGGSSGSPKTDEKCDALRLLRPLETISGGGYTGGLLRPVDSGRSGTPMPRGPGGGLGVGACAVACAGAARGFAAGGACNAWKSSASASTADRWLTLPGKTLGRA